MPGKALGVDGGRGDHHLQVGPLRQDLAQRDGAIALARGEIASYEEQVAAQVGPVTRAKLDGWIHAALRGGAKALVRGKRLGNLLGASLLRDVPHDADLQRKEAFGPIACIDVFDNFDDAIARVNDSDFGLQAGVFTARIDHAMRAWDRLEVGGVVVGDVPSVRVDNMPYGGIKQSGVGREGVRCAIEDMTEPRLLVLRD